MMAARRDSCSPRPAQRRGSVYVLVLGTGLLVSIIGLSAMLATRVRQHAAQDQRHAVAARLAAQSAIDLGLLAIDGDADWRAARTPGFWIQNQVLGDAVFSLHADDPSDGDLADNPCDSLVLTGYGYAGATRQILRVTLTADAAHEDPFFDRVQQYAPVAYWRLGETDGGEALDVAGGHTGFYRNGVELGVATASRCDSACRFDGANDHVEIPHHDDFLLNKGTLLAWFTTESVWTEQGILSKDSNGYDDGGHVYIAVSGGRVVARIQSTSASYNLYSGNISANRWYQVALNFGPSGTCLFINETCHDYESYGGGLGTSSGGAGNHEPLAIGINTYNSGDLVIGIDQPFRGLIDEVVVFGEQLWSDELAGLYELGRQPATHTMAPAAGSWAPLAD